MHVTWEEGTRAAWLYDLLQPQVEQVLVCNPHRNALLKGGSKSDKADALKRADLLRTAVAVAGGSSSTSARCSCRLEAGNDVRG
ncbi:MAG: hypothetical protein DMG97_37905 [Acidobacteria bacterium]|nr:MAG: hypothetical protein DMG97_37905 [Acidobacteriota bacterium]PYX59099.1 MAG: hypothetical protein DMG76_06745 [Acidobacteriota bacterium]